MTLDTAAIQQIREVFREELTRILRPLTASDLTDLKPWDMDAESRKKHYRALRDAEKKGGKR